MSFPAVVNIVEVGPRDGLQNEATVLPTAIKVDFIHGLAAAGLRTIEATSFVSPKWIPQLADGQSVLQQLHLPKEVRCPVLVPNLKGYQRAFAAGAKEIAVFSTPSEQFSQKNTHCSVAESVQRIAAVMEEAKQHRVRVRAYLSCVLGCPYEGEMAISKVVKLAEALFTMGCDEISLGDTIGVGTPRQTKKLLQAMSQVVPITQTAVHFHDTYAQALTNIYVALETGITIIDSSVAGLGGCPYAKGASGNVATEDVVYMLHGMGIETGIDLEKLIVMGRWISSQFGRPPRSKVNLAWAPIDN